MSYAEALQSAQLSPPFRVIPHLGLLDPPVYLELVRDLSGE